MIKKRIGSTPEELPAYWKRSRFPRVARQEIDYFIGISISASEGKL
jgi:hypothetical protein